MNARLMKLRNYLAQAPDLITTSDIARGTGLPNFEVERLLRTYSVRPAWENGDYFVSAKVLKALPGGEEPA